MVFKSVSLLLILHKLSNINWLKIFFFLLKIVVALTHDTRFYKTIIIHVFLGFKKSIAGWTLDSFVINMHSYTRKLKSIPLVVFWSCKNLNWKYTYEHQILRYSPNNSFLCMIIFQNIQIFYSILTYLNLEI